MTDPEFSRRVGVDTIGVGHSLAIAADDTERAGLARRFGWRGIARLEADATLALRAGGVDASGRLRAAVTQACVVTGDPVASEIDQDFALRFVESGLMASGEEEVELAEADLDIVDFDGHAVDLGEAAAQTLALALDPFPRSAAAEARLKEAGVLGEGETGPFAALKDLLKP